MHSYYTRMPRDLPFGDQTVRLRLRVRRFRCSNSECSRVTFAERFPEVLPLHGRRTWRLAHSLQAVGFALGGEAGQRLAVKLHMPTSADTLLRTIMRAPALDQQASKVVGVDDWAWRRGHSYGTLLVDLERHRVIDLLPDRTAETLAQWLRSHPGIEIVTRDRSTEYARGITLGAPEAIQVADRWHLLLNLREALERMLDRAHTGLRSLPEAHASPAAKSPGEIGSFGPLRRERRSETEQAIKQGRRSQRLARYEQVQALNGEGLNILQIARRLRMSRVTVRRYLGAESFPERQPPPPKASLLDPFSGYLQTRWRAGCQNALQLWREIQAQGFTGSRKAVARWAWERREVPATSTPTKYVRTFISYSDVQSSGGSGTGTSSLPGARRLVWLLLRQATTLTTEEISLLTHIRQAPALEAAYQLAQKFLKIVRGKVATDFEAWLTACVSSGIPDLQNFATGLRHDYEAVLAALKLPWSNGQTEGQVNRLKFLKRQMYGRAGFALLRRRVLHSG